MLGEATTVLKFYANRRTFTMVQSTEYHGGYSYLISNTNEDLGIKGQIGPTYLSLKILKCR